MKQNNYHVWIDTGYRLFAEEGHEGILIERLARITGLNKSGFYHYFGDTHEYLKHLIQEHERIIDSLLDPMSKVQNYDPEYLEILVQNKDVAFFQIQLVRNRHMKLFVECHDRNNIKTAPIVTPLFCKELGLPLEAAYPYYEMMRDLYYMRADYKSYNYEFLHSIVEHCKNLVSAIKDSETKD